MKTLLGLQVKDTHVILSLSPKKLSLEVIYQVIWQRDFQDHEMLT